MIFDSLWRIFKPEPSNEADYSGDFDVPDGRGLLIYIDGEGQVRLRVENDANFPKIHRNCYGPADLKDTRLLHGGGSGTAVFSGRHRIMGKVVGKHGHQQDTREVLALAKIAAELRIRGLAENGKASERMRNRIPKFVAVYVSKYHIRNRAQELSRTLRRESFITLKEAALQCQGKRAEDAEGEDSSFLASYVRSSFGRMQAEERAHRDLQVVKGEDTGFEVTFRKVYLHIPGYDAQGVVENGDMFLSVLTEELAREQEQHFFKVSLFQSEIGGHCQENGSTVLNSGRLKNHLLEKLLQDFGDVMQDLRKLTKPEEKEGVEAARTELEKLRVTKDLSLLSKAADSFCGHAIKKNFMPGTGRFAYLRQFGEECRSGSFTLTSEEPAPVSLLGKVLARGQAAGEVFDNLQSDYSVLDQVEDSWVELLEHATGIETSAATDCIWTSGLTDAGLHNTFLSSERGLELFDLGKPSCMPLPAFLTKFLMSFFHTLGMQDDASGLQWINRFTVQTTGGVELTERTRAMMPFICSTFRAVLHHFVDNFFDKDPEVSSLLVRYVVLQLLSDASFCLQKWERKGGGRERIGEEVPLQKWLWRALWDLYIASYVHFELSIE